MRLSLNRGTDLAMRALSRLDEAEGALTGSDLAAQIGTTISFLPQIMSPLIRRGWVESDRGPGGGYRLTDTAAEASLLDIIEATEGSTEDGRCVLRDARCPEESCPIHLVWMEARRHLVEGFGGIAALETQHEGVSS